MRTWETPSTRATPLRTRSRSSFGTKSARLRAMAPASLHLELREGAGVVPVRGEDPLVLVVTREPADPGLDQLEPALVRQVRRVRRDVDLEVHGPFHEGAEVLRELPGQPLPREDLRDGLASREPDVRDRVQVPQAKADRRLRVALPVELDHGLHDLVRFEGHPLRVLRDERAGRAVLALPLRVDSRHGGDAIPRVGIRGLRGLRGLDGGDPSLERLEPGDEARDLLLQLLEVLQRLVREDHRAGRAPTRLRGGDRHRDSRSDRCRDHLWFSFHIGLVPVQVGCGARPLEGDAVRWTMAEPEYDVSVVRGIAEASILLSLLFVATILAGVFVTQLLALPPLFPPPWNSVGLVPAIGGGASLVYCAAFLSRHGRGTPYPRLPPRRLVTTGPFARVRNPS